MKPEEAIALPFVDSPPVRQFMDPYRERAHRAFVEVCNAYPLALALAEAVQSEYDIDHCDGPCLHQFPCNKPPKAIAEALSAFLAHRNTEAKP